MRRIYRKLYSAWPLATKRKLQRNTFGWRGGMLPTIRDYDPMTYVMLDKGEVIGWALVLERPIADDFAMFYVKSCYRRQGVGTKIANRIKKDYVQLYVEPHNRASDGFFASVGIPDGMHW